MKRPPALKVKTERSPHRSSPSPQTPPTPHYPSLRTNSWLMNALFVLRPAKLWAFNIGHPCPSLAKGSWLAARLACFKNHRSSRYLQRPNLTKFICRKTERSPPPTLPLLLSLPNEYILRSIRRGGGLPLPPPRLSPSPQTPPTPHYPHHKKPGISFHPNTRLNY